MRKTDGKKTSTTRRPSRRKNAPEKGSKLADLEVKPDRFLECYEFRHAYKLIGRFHWGSGGICRRAACTRCGTIRETYYRADMTILDYRYIYPDGYLKIGEGKVTSTDIVREATRRSGVQTDTVERLPKSSKAGRRHLRAV